MAKDAALASPAGRTGSGRKLSDDQVLEIRRLANVPCGTCGVKPSLRALGERFGVSAPAILDIVERRSWRHVSDKPVSADAAEMRLAAAAELLRRHNIALPDDALIGLAADVIDAARAERRAPR